MLGILVFANIYNKNLEENLEIIESFEVENNQALEEIENEKIYVYVTGEVKNSIVVELNVGDRVEDAIEKAGGITENANIKNINLAKPVEDGEKIYVPNKDENIENINNENSSAKININRATKAELQTLAGIGPAMATKIIEYRQENGSFKSIDEIKEVSGIGESKFKEIEKFITI